MGTGRIILSAVAAFAIAMTAVIAAPAPSAQALVGSDFDPGYIISDSQFYDGNAMSESSIQSFLDARIAEAGGCTTSHCLAIYRTNTATKPADIRSGGVVVCNGYQAGSNESAARIIFKVQQSCGISARVLLVTLQKEQSLLSARAPSSWQMQASMGYGCPDSTPGECDANYYGFFNQMYQAAWQLKRYSVPDYWYFNFKPGSHYIGYNPNPDCGGSWVNILNNATAALYNYTPYQPNQASLDNLYGSGGTCGAHGNRNFWVFYSTWFGNPAGIVPDVATHRIAGVDRFDTSVKMSQALGAQPGVVYVANGLNYPDGLSAAPAAAHATGPVLLVTPTSIPDSVRAELGRLHGTIPRIVVVGSSDSVSDAVAEELKAYAPEVVRLGGSDRFATSLEIAKQFPAGVTRTAYIANGMGFADALSAGSAAGSRGAPVILVNGAAPSADAAMLERLTALGATNIIIAGNEASVSAGVANSIASLPGTTVTRLGGTDRFDTANLIVKDAFPTSARVYLANGMDFPDALSGSALAAAHKAPLLLAPPSCVTRQTAQSIIDLGADSVTLFGGPTTLTPEVATFRNCS